MKTLNVLLIYFFVFFLPGCVTMRTLKPKTYKVQIPPKLDISPSRRIINSSLKVFLSDKITNALHIERGQGNVLITVENFRESVQAAVVNALKPQFKSISVEQKESRKGLELVILDANYPNPVDVLAFHFALMNKGKLVYENKDKTTPITRKLAVSLNTWQDEMSKATVTTLEENIADMAKQIQNSLLINDKLLDFWNKY